MRLGLPRVRNGLGDSSDTRVITRVFGCSLGSSLFRRLRFELQDGFIFRRRGLRAAPGATTAIANTTDSGDRAVRHPGAGRVGDQCRAYLDVKPAGQHCPAGVGIEDDVDGSGSYAAFSSLLSHFPCAARLFMRARCANARCPAATFSVFPPHAWMAAACSARP